MMNASCLKKYPGGSLFESIHFEQSQCEHKHPAQSSYNHTDWPLMESTILKKKLRLNVALPNDPNSNVTIINGSYMN